MAISAHIDRMGMEYPMVSFNGYRPEEDGTYSERTKRGLIGVIIHEVGHFWFPMIVNSDERQWTWMDEGLNSFLDDLAKSSKKELRPSSIHVHCLSSELTIIGNQKCPTSCIITPINPLFVLSEYVPSSSGRYPLNETIGYSIPIRSI